MKSRTNVVEASKDPQAQGASARDRALRFNRGIIGLCLVVLAMMLFMPI